jgi:hypothetical protein
MRPSNVAVLGLALGLGTLDCKFDRGARPGSGTGGTESDAGGDDGGGTGGRVMRDATVAFDLIMSDGGGLTLPGLHTPCTGISCQQSTCKMGSCTVPACAGGTRTTLRGRIFDPAGRVPLYNITVYVPNKPLDDIVDGPSCDPCNPATGTSLVSGEPIALAKTDTNGAFTLGLPGDAGFGDVPAGTGIPLVIQVGKWRRQVMVDVPACAQTELTNTDLLRLPRSQAEGHIPKMALTTGSLDALECLLRKVGIADAEFTPESGTGRVNFYAGGGGTAAYDATLNGGAAFTSVRPWWDSLDNLKKYDIILHSCEGQQGSFSGNQDPTSTKSMEARQALQAYADLGGRVFASHWHVYWFERGPAPFQSIATFNHRMPGLPNPYNATVDQGHEKGMALAQWLVAVNGSPMLGVLPIAQDANQTTVDTVAGGMTSQRWIYAADRNPQAVQYLTATTPIPGGSCGRVVLSDIHVSSGGANSDTPNRPFPAGCTTTELSPQEKALEFMLFDIASCVQGIVE